MPDGLSGDGQDQQWYDDASYTNLDYYATPTDTTQADQDYIASWLSDPSNYPQLQSYLPDATDQPTSTSDTTDQSFTDYSSYPSYDPSTGQIYSGDNSIDPVTGIVTDVNGDQWWPQRDGTYASTNTGDVYDPSSGSIQSQDAYAASTSIQADPVSYGNQFASTDTPSIGSYNSVSRNSNGDKTGSAGSGGLSVAAPARPPTNPPATPTATGNPLTDLLNGLLNNVAKVLSAPKAPAPIPVSSHSTIPGTTNPAAKGLALPPAISSLPKQAVADLQSNPELMWLAIAAGAIILISKHKSKNGRYNSSR